MKTKQLFISLVLGLGLTLALLWLLGGSPPMARAQGPDRYDTYYVAPGGDCGSVTPCYASVQAAVDAASDGDIIKVAAGIYTGVQRHTAPLGYYPPTVITQVVYISKTVTICGGYTTTNAFAGPPDPLANLTTLDAQKNGRVIYITGNISPTIEGLRITGGDAAGMHNTHAHEAGGGVYVITATATISNNQVFSNAATDGAGLFLKHSDATLSGNTIRDNTAHRAGGGLFVHLGAPMLSGNTITNNTAITLAGGIHLLSSTATLSGNIIRENKAKQGGGLFMRLSAPTLSGNTIQANIADVGGGLRLAEQTSATLSYNTIAFNTAERSGGGLSLANYCTVTLSHNDIIANIAGWDGGGLRLTDYSSATLSDNTIKANTANFGGGLFLALTSTATISENTFICNSARGAGGGLRLAQNGSARLISNTITANTAYNGGGMHLNNSTAELSDNIFAANEALHNGGGLMLAFTSTATLSGNKFATNEAKHGGGGLYVCQYSSATLSGDTVISNTIDAADYGGGGGLALTTTSTLTCTNAIIADNRVNGPPGIGAGLVIGDSSARLLHITIARNSGGDDSGIHVTERHGTYSTVALTNTILVGHKVGITVTAGNTATLEATLWGTDTWANRIAAWGGSGSITTGTVNVWGDPAFVDPNVGNYHIGPGSAALNVGVDAGVTVDFDGEPRTVDIDGEARPIGMGYDIGADEFQAALSATKQPSVIWPSMGETITYIYTVTNTGNVRLTDVSADDDLLGTISLFTNTLGPGEITTGTATYLVQESDLPGWLINVVTVTAKPPVGDDVTAHDTKGVYVPLTPAIKVDKETSVTTAHMGETITYTYMVRNTGNVSLKDIRASDDRLGAIRLVTTTLKPGEITTGTATYLVQESDLPGPLTNTVSVTTMPPVTDTDSVSVPLTITRALDVVKQASVDTASVGETITYIYTVDNTGDVTLADVKANDNRLGAISLATTTLAPGEITTGTATHIVVVGDLLRGPLVNTVTVTGTSPVGDVVTDTNSASVELRPPCLHAPAFGAVLLVLLSVVLRRKK